MLPPLIMSTLARFRLALGKCRCAWWNIFNRISACSFSVVYSCHYFLPYPFLVGLIYWIAQLGTEVLTERDEDTLSWWIYIFCSTVLKARHTRYGIPETSDRFAWDLMDTHAPVKRQLFFRSVQVLQEIISVVILLNVALKVFFSM